MYTIKVVLKNIYNKSSMKNIYNKSSMKKYIQ